MKDRPTENIQFQIDQEDSLFNSRKQYTNHMIQEISYRDLIPPKQDRVASDYRDSLSDHGFLPRGF